MKVKDLFNLNKDYKNIKLISGADGLNNNIDSIEILEVPDGVYWVEENDLIITTGYFLNNNTDAFKSFIETLSYRKAAAVGIKLGRFIDEIPQEILKISNDKRLPIIKIPPHIKYSNILWPVMTNLTNENKYEKYILDKYKSELLFLVRNDFRIESITELLCNYTGSHCVIYSKKDYTMIKNDYSINSEDIKSLIEENYEKIITTDNYSNIFHKENNYYVIKIMSIKETLSYLCIKTNKDEELNATDFKIIEETVPYLSIYLLSSQEKTVNYNKSLKEFWYKLTKGNYNNRDLVLKEDAVSLGVDYNKNRFIWVINKIRNGSNEFLYKIIKEYMQSYDKDYHIIEDSDKIIVVTSLNKNQIDLKLFNGMFIDLLGQINIKHKNDKIKIGISKTCASLKYLSYAFEEAMFALQFGDKIKENNIFYYDDCMIYHLLHEVSGHPSLTKIYRNTLQKIEKYDKKNKSNLMETIEKLIECDFSINNTASKLFIHRNTLYKRISKINEVLEFDIDDSEGRLILQIAMKLNKII
ncbi:MAG: PucR family transcriptional regulator ligand-binding domain-containing protein [Bacillota bacterium]|nr:PucR family transcriptional regulator ligand-binding domain-containing protein [Bacillota bacterium]